MITKETAEKIYDVLTKQDFWDFYTDDGEFECHIRADENCPTKEQVLEKIQKLFARLDGK